MNQRIAQIALVVKDYAEAIDFYTNILGFKLIEDTSLDKHKRWVVVSPPGDENCSLLLAKAADDKQRQSIGNQAGGRVFLFLYTDDFSRDYQAMIDRGVVIVDLQKFLIMVPLLYLRICMAIGGIYWSHRNNHSAINMNW
ncbi:VOC family protein [Marinoscillum pacificum]|uniref:VOC family protein n=1 Tax=Marinoscillum pacificum TaxID=392723 RepID=UPI00280C2093|nr:VOC family protein [Marinoscillum pacificum]